MSIDFSSVKSWDIPEGEVLSASLNGVTIWEKQSPQPQPLITADVTFIDYDGTILYEFTAAEALALTALPSAPDHSNDGTYLGIGAWTYTKQSLTTQVTECGKAIVGVNYSHMISPRYSSDYGEVIVHVIDVVGTVRIYLNANASSASSGSPGYLYFDWGDGTRDTWTFRNTSTVNIDISHTYSTRGDYQIVIFQDSYRRISIQEYTGGNFPFWNNFDKTYMSDKIHKMFVSNKVSVLDFLYGCSNLEYYYGYPVIGPTKGTVCNSCGNLKFASGLLVAPQGSCNNDSNLILADVHDTSVDYRNMFNSCGIEKFYCKYNINLFDSFNDCANLVELILPSGYSRGPYIDNSFKNCSSLQTLKFTSIWFSPLYNISNDSFQNLPTTCKIYVPSAKMADYKALSGMPDPSIYEYIGY